MKSCRECGHRVSEQAFACPDCGAPYPAREKWDGYGFEYRSKAEVLGLPLVHISFKYRPNRTPVVVPAQQQACHRLASVAVRARCKGGAG